MEPYDWLGLMASDVEPLPRFRKLVEDKATKGECLRCAKKAKKRQLCGKHYYRFREDKRDKAPSRRRTFENQEIRMGRVGQDRQGQGEKKRKERKAGAA